jgi:hypothetical protein
MAILKIMQDITSTRFGLEAISYIADRFVPKINEGINPRIIKADSSNK